MRILLSSLIALIVCGSSDAFAQAKKIDCSKLEFSISLPFQECTLELSSSMAIRNCPIFDWTSIAPTLFEVFPSPDLYHLLC